MTELEYYDPARQEIRSEHGDCILEDGVRWFGHGMECKHPEWHHRCFHRRSDHECNCDHGSDHGALEYRYPWGES